MRNSLHFTQTIFYNLQFFRFYTKKNIYKNEMGFTSSRRLKMHSYCKIKEQNMVVNNFLFVNLSISECYVIFYFFKYFGIFFYIYLFIINI